MSPLFTGLVVSGLGPHGRWFVTVYDLELVVELAALFKVVRCDDEGLLL